MHSVFTIGMLLDQRVWDSSAQRDCGRIQTVYFDDRLSTLAAISLGRRWPWSPLRIIMASDMCWREERIEIRDGAVIVEQQPAMTWLDWRNLRRRIVATDQQLVGRIDDVMCAADGVIEYLITYGRSLWDVMIIDRQTVLQIGSTGLPMTVAVMPQRRGYVVQQSDVMNST